MKQPLNFWGFALQPISDDTAKATVVGVIIIASIVAALALFGPCTDAEDRKLPDSSELTPYGVHGTLKDTRL